LGAFRQKKRTLFELFIAVYLAVLNQHCVGAPQVVITNLPAYGSFDNLQGIILDANPASNAVAALIYVPGYGWVSKPTCAQTLAALQSDASWSADITTGGSDQLATRVAAFLVKTNYSQPCVDGAAFLPTNIFGQAIASAVVTRQSPDLRWMKFSGYDWWVKSSLERVGPGPNYYSDSTNNVFLDSQGQLHLRITNRSNQWQCAEIVSARTFGFGHYRFELGSSVDNLNQNVVLGLFTWSHDPAFTHREIDVECSRWGNTSDTNNSQFVVQPSDPSGHLVRFEVPTSVTNSTQSFVWESNRVSFRSEQGSYSVSPAPANVLSTWNYALEVPQTGDENVRMNLWFFTGAAPTDDQEVEIIIKSFTFVPLPPAQPALLSHFARLPSGQLQFDLQAEPDRHYALSASCNLTDWQNLTTILATNNVMIFSDTNSIGLDQRFFRAETLQ